MISRLVEDDPSLWLAAGERSSGDRLGDRQAEPDGAIAVQVDRIPKGPAVPAQVLAVQDDQAREPGEDAADELLIGGRGPGVLIPLAPGGHGGREDPVNRDAMSLGQAQEFLDVGGMEQMGLPSPLAAAERLGKRPLDRDEDPGRDLGPAIESPVALEDV